MRTTSRSNSNISSYRANNDSRKHVEVLAVLAVVVTMALVIVIEIVKCVAAAVVLMEVEIVEVNMPAFICMSFQCALNKI